MPTPRIDLSLFNARIFDVTDFEVTRGENFSLKVQSETVYDWFTNNDEVLNVKVTGNIAEMQANNPGECAVLIMDTGRKIVRELHITVVSLIVPEADKLDVQVDATQPK